MMDFAKTREIMVDRQIRTADVTDHRVLSAFAEVRRELFVPAGLRQIAYSDGDLPLLPGRDGDSGRYVIGPAALARLVQLAEIDAGNIVLDVGCATGFGAAVLARLADAVVALESNEELAAAARETLLELGIGNAAVVTGRLEAGYPAEGPYDAIIVEGAVEAVPEALFEQLKDGGRLVAVIGPGPAGMATLYRRSGTDVSGRPAFNIALPALPGFARPKTFVF